MSHTLRNLLVAIRHCEEHGSVKKITERPSLFMYLKDHERFDMARETYYGHDEHSLSVFDWRMQHASLTGFYGSSPPFFLENAPVSLEEWRELEKKAVTMTEGFAEGDYLLDRIDTWLMESYSLKGICEAATGDVVLDCGAFTGNTSLYFSRKVGPEGHVYSFEPLLNSFSLLSRNLRRVPNATPFFYAVSDKPGIVRFSLPPSQQSAAASISESGSEVKSISLDAFVKKNRIPKVDFIKMDIEGGEGDALCGAAETIHTFRPKMALSAYHKFYDLVDLPEQVLSIDPGYVFYLKHFSVDLSETVLFCVPQKETVLPGNRKYPDYVMDGEDRAELMNWIGKTGAQIWDSYVTLVDHTLNRPV